MKTFEEWFAYLNISVGPNTILWMRNAWNKAREGMVELPPESEWPDRAAKIALCWVSNDGDYWLHMLPQFPRANPKWQPKPGDRCAFWDKIFVSYSVLIGYELVEGLQSCKETDGTTWRHCALLESIDDIGKDVEFFKSQRKWC